MNRCEMRLKNKKILTSLLVTTSELSTRQDTVTDLFLFLLRYPFLLNNASKTPNSRGLKTPQFPTPQGNIYMGARYLDPKYSRWISVDPALSEYIPGAGKSNEAGKLPGMGGVFNSVNGNLYHYAGNNPVIYNDLDGRETHELTDEQWEVVSKAKEEAISDLKVIIEKLSDFSMEGDEKLEEAAKIYLGRDFSIVEDYVFLKAQCQSLITKLSKMNRSNFKYDDFNFNPKKSGVFGWCVFAFGKTIYLGNNFFSAEDSGNDSKSGVLIHEATHLCGFAIDVFPNPYGVKNARKKILKTLNADNYEYFYEYIFKGGF